MVSIRQAHPTLRRGAQVVRLAEDEGGLLVVSRVLGDEEIVIAYNAETRARQATVRVDGASSAFTALAGACAPAPTAPGVYQVDVPALSFIVCKAGG
jgi:hypothetical protein